MISKDKISELRNIQDNAFESGRITAEENEKLNVIHEKIESLSSISNPTQRQYEELTVLLTQSGDIMLGTNLASKAFNGN